MRSGFTVVCASLLTGINCSAGTLTDTFRQSQNNCILTYTAPYDTCDVVGNEMLYDIQKATVSINNEMATISIETNTGAIPYGDRSLTLTAFNDGGVPLIPGDIFFYNPTSGQGNLEYGIALTDHGAFKAGDLYSISGGTSTETAQAALQDGSDFYRRDQTVLMTGTGRPASSGAVTVTSYGDGIKQPEYEITATVPVTSGLLNLLSNGQIGLLFSSADCGNDVIQGVVDTGYTTPGGTQTNGVVRTPEPGPGGMMLTGLVLVAVGYQWRKRTAQISGN